MEFKDEIVNGMMAGTLATLPMTAFMMLMHDRLPWYQQGPLPPDHVTSETLEAIGLKKLDYEHHEAATLAGHFVYGAASGALYPLIHKLPGPTFVKSIGFGVALWAVSYMGWLPAIGMLEPATERPNQRNLLMIVAHAIWGLATGALVHLLGEE